MNWYKSLWFPFFNLIGGMDNTFLWERMLFFAHYEQLPYFFFPFCFPSSCNTEITKLQLVRFVVHTPSQPPKWIEVLQRDSTGDWGDEAGDDYAFHLWRGFHFSLALISHGGNYDNNIIFHDLSRILQIQP